MRKNVANLVGTIMLSTPHWMRKKRLYSLLLLMFSVMLILSSATQFVQIASATASSDQLETESDIEPESVQVNSACEPGPGYEIEKCITDVNCMGSKASVKEAGDVITYLIAVTNTGDVDLTNVTVTDPLIETLTGPVESKDTDGVLDVGETWTYTGSYVVTQEDIDTNGGCDGYIDNVAMVDCDQLETKCDSATAPIEEASAGDDSTGDDSTGDDSTGDDSTGDDSTEDDSTEDNLDYFIYKSIIGADEAGDSIVNEAGDIIEYQIMVKNEGSTNLTGVSVSDPMITLTGPSGDDVDSGVLNPAETWKFFGNYTVTQDDINSNGGGDGFIENTAIVSCNELPDESSSVQQLIVLSSADSDRSGDTRTAHHSNGGTGHARIISKPTKNIEVNENTGKETGTETQLGPDIKNFEQNTESTEADIEKEPEQENAGIPGFEIVYGVVGLLAAIFLYKRK